MARREHEVREHTRRLSDGRITTVRRHTRTREGADRDNFNQNQYQYQNQNEVHYEPSSLFNLFAGAGFFILCGALIISLLSGGISSISGKLPALTGKNTTAAHQSEKALSDAKIHKDLKLKEDASDEIFGFISTKISGVEDVVVMDMAKVKNVKTYKKKVISKLKKYDDGVVFVLVSLKNNNTEKQDELMEKVKGIASDNMDLLTGTPYSKINLLRVKDLPGAGNCVCCLTFKKGG